MLHILGLWSERVQALEMITGTPNDSLADIMLMHFCHLFVFQMCVCVKVETPCMNTSKSSGDFWTLDPVHTSSHVTRLKTASRPVPVLRHCQRIPRRTTWGVGGGVVCVGPSLRRAGNVGCPCMEHQLWEAAQGYEEQMDVRATSVLPPGSTLSTETLPHTLDGSQEKMTFFTEFKKTGRLLFTL